MTTWISVDDRLPETKQLVLAWNQYGPSDRNRPDRCLCIAVRQKVGDIVLNKQGRDDLDRVVWYQSNYHGTLTHVTHWMPLPEPP